MTLRALQCVLPEWISKHRVYINFLVSTFHFEVGCPAVTSSGGEGKDGEDLRRRRRAFKKNDLTHRAYETVFPFPYASDVILFSSFELNPLRPSLLYHSLPLQLLHPFFHTGSSLPTLFHRTEDKHKPLTCG